MYPNEDHSVLVCFRIFVLNLINLYTLFIALYNKQNDLVRFCKCVMWWWWWWWWWWR